MAKNAETRKKAGDGADGSGWTDVLPDALKDASKRASELAQNPYARSLLAAGLVAAAAALASNKSVRDATRRNLRAATDAVEVGADNAGKIGLAIVNAATEAVQSLLTLTGAASDAAAAAKPAASGKAPARAKAAPRKPATAKAKAPAKAGGAAKAGSASTAKKPAAAAGRKAAPKRTAAARATKPPQG